MLVVENLEHGIQAYQEGEFQEALTSFKKTLSDYPDHALAYLWEARTYQALGNEIEAIESLNRALENTDDETLIAQANLLKSSLISAETSGPMPEDKALIETFSIESADDIGVVKALVEAVHPTAYVQPEKNVKPKQPLPLKRIGGQVEKKFWTWRDLSLRAKATLLSVLLGSVPTLFVGGGAYFAASRAIESQIQQEEVATTRDISVRVATYMRERFGDIQIMASLNVFTNPALRAVASAKTKEETLNEFINAYKIYDSIAVFDLEGNVISQSSGEKLGNHANRSYFKEALKTQKPILSQPILSESDGNIAVYIASVVKDSVSAQPIGVARARLPVSFLENLVESTDNSGKIFLLDKSGKVFANSEGDAVKVEGGKATLSSAESIGPGIDKLRQNQVSASLQTVTSKGGENNTSQKLFSYVPFAELTATKDPFLKDLPNLGWDTVIQTETKDAYAPAAKLLNSLQISISVAVVLVAIIGSLLARQAIKPLIISSEGVKRLGSGDLDTRLEVTSDDELGTL